MMTSTAPCASSSISSEFPTREAPHVANSRRWLSQFDSGGKTKSKSKLLIHTQGERYGSREYMLLPSTIPVDDLDDNDPEVSALIRKYRIASLRANRNVLFGAKCFASIGGSTGISGGEDSNSSSENLVKACTPLVKTALNDAGSNGEQPQALASLDGLCAWVESCLANNGKGGKELESIVNQMEEGREDAKLFEACKAIATGKPRPGHRVLGAGTYRDGQPLWEKLAQEYAAGGGVPDMMASEVELYRANGMEIVAVEHLADTSAQYLKSAGGAMVRLFYV